MFLMGDARQVHLRRWATYFIEAGYDVLTVSLEPGDGFPGPFQRIRVWERLPDAVRYPLAARRVMRIMDEFVPDVVSAHFVPNYGLIAALVCQRPWVLSTWGSDVMTDPDKSPFHHRRTRFVLNRAAFVTSDARVLTERIVSFGVAEERIREFPYGVDTERFRPATPAGSRGPRIISNRKLESLYAVETAIDAMAAVREALPDATLTVAGDGSERRALERRAAASPAAEAITFAGPVAHPDMPALLAAHDIYLSTARSDTTSVSLLEAMACGLFPVVTDIPANREWINDGENGRLVPPGEPRRLAVAVVDSWRDAELRARARGINLRVIEERARWDESMRPARQLFDMLTADGGS
jgi:glycosyltransferase involved in cell wall biosynthesis